MPWPRIENHPAMPIHQFMTVHNVYPQYLLNHKLTFIGFIMEL